MKRDDFPLSMVIVGVLLFLAAWSIYTMANDLKDTQRVVRELCADEFNAAACERASE